MDRPVRQSRADGIFSSGKNSDRRHSRSVLRQQALAILLGEPFFSSQAPPIAEVAAQQRLATMFWTRRPVESGGLMSYGQNNAEHYYRAATYIDKILKGAKPGDLAVEQATKSSSSST